MIVLIPDHTHLLFIFSEKVEIVEDLIPNVGLCYMLLVLLFVLEIFFLN